ncbi:hypothetical protein A2716_04435 [candidate division WWE3 bacterium RIFCSPHIGHO2_01_FULL_40_23]|uniref:Glucose/Sorbosone dehydrogenase domain-containing protein n=1 Tax=candidate division WWE3 bacterium RIFCSPLOWO2_01_FULL_41_18 TaxID=1802625 RepID=A0A1F4VD27_UNCKA|nr:MAG: hypothetical protein A2716_04435 [candidate division WWE3 bacterium RIFCSPHIGHO2_01_FULL_40_23]OGC55121.1 MAG: hypothetical protein A3A78_04045 [candidate division WWE3 bacterium RIFCSPLOWO2_01_FULL_41_18]
MKKATLTSIVILILLTALLFLYLRISQKEEESTKVIPKKEEKVAEETPAAEEIFAKNLEIPWDIAFLPDGDLLVTERTGVLKRFSKDGSEKGEVKVSGVNHYGEGGLLGLVLHPKFLENRYLYLYLTSKKGLGFENRIERYKYEDGSLSDRNVILGGIPGAIYHDGGRMAFGPDGYLYVTVGDATNSDSAQDTNSLAGKILRMTDEGKAPLDNPFNNLVYSYGHRNPQGLTWDDAGRLWSTEHGRSGALSGLDELNLIEKGKNYGWPVIEGDKKKENMENPLLHSGPDHTWAPASALFYEGSIFFGGLRGEALYEAKISNGNVVLKEHFKNKYGRIRTVTLGSDGFFYLTTSNRDGRGDVNEGDDRIIKVNPKVL